MFLIRLAVVLELFISWTSAGPVNKDISPRQTQSLDPCGDVIAWVKNDYKYFDAHFVYECLRSVQFIPDVATRFLKYYNTTIQFHAPLDSLKNPPRGYQQRPVDIVLGLRALQSKIDNGQYKNQYEFEADVQRLIARMHDPHAQLNAGILAAFVFASPFGIISASTDGKEAPGIYIDRDVVHSNIEDWDPSPIVKINGKDPVQYLLRYAEENAASYLESHAEWNSLMESPVADVLGAWSAFQQGNIYPGEEDDAKFIVELKNGTKVSDTWSAIYKEAQDTGPLSTSGDFYNYFVMGWLPSGWRNAGKWWPDRSLNDSTQPDPLNPFETICPQDNSLCVRSSNAFPQTPDVIQGDLELSDDEVITGYIFPAASIGVLSIPHFYSADTGEYDSFRTAVQNFILKAQKQKIKRVVIDVQQNIGGHSLRAYDTFKLFFPEFEPYGASRARKSELANVLGSAYTTAFRDGRLDEDVAANYAANEWVIDNRVHADQNRRFRSWQEYSTGSTGYTEPQKYNLSDIEFDLSGFGAIPWGYDPDIDDEDSGRPFEAENIVILTDGLCGSACSLFVEFMSHQAGVRTIAVGGRPETGPMQAVSGSRAAAAYDADALDDDMLQVNDTLHDQDAYARLPSRTDTGMWINHAGFSIRNQVRQHDPMPLQFHFQAADCRIYYTLKNVYNMTRLWHDVAHATWEDQSICVKGSTGYPSYRNNNSTKIVSASANTTKPVTFEYNPDAPKSDTSTFKIQDSEDHDDRVKIHYEPCSKLDDSKNTPDKKCLYMDVECRRSTKRKTTFTVAVPYLQPQCEISTKSKDCGTGRCKFFSKAPSKSHTNGNANIVASVGYCTKTNPGNQEKFCGPDEPAKTPLTDRALRPEFKCDKKPIKYKDMVTKVECSARKRIYNTQTFAVWSREDTNKAGVAVGTCKAYTCTAPTRAQTFKQANSTVFLWASEVSKDIMKGIGG